MELYKTTNQNTIILLESQKEENKRNEVRKYLKN